MISFPKLKAGVIIMILAFSSVLPGEVLLDPPFLELDPKVYAEGIFTGSIIVENRDDRPLGLSLMTGGAQWSVDPAELTIEPGETASLELSGPLPGDSPVSLILLSDREDVPYLYTVSLKGSGEPDLLGEKGDQVFVFFYTPGCRICEEFTDSMIPDLLERGLLNTPPETRNIYDPGSFEMMGDLLEKRQEGGDEFPLLVMGDLVFRGEKSLFEDFPVYLENPDSYSRKKPQRIWDLHLFSVLLAGLLDGINPCAFTTLIFLISYLRLFGRKGREILKIGGSFTLAVFISYFLIGLGFFQLLRMAESFHLISNIIRYVMIGLLLVLSFMSFYDFLKVQQGRASESLLQLSKEAKKRIHATVRKRSRSSLLMISSFGAGVLISLYELGCTGQIYLPMLVYMVKQDPGIFSLFPLLLYNLGFILPLMVVFFLFYRGSDSGRLAVIFERHLAKVKLSTSVLFLLIALLLFLSV